MKNFLRSLSKNFPLYFPKCFSRNFLRRFTRHFPKIFPPRIYRLRSPRRGYIAILLVAFIPVILLGTRWVLDTVTLQKIKINMMPVEGETQKKCAAQAALAVAQNWNPGLPLSRQKNTALKIADAVYNDNTPVVTNDSNILAKAIPGLQLEVVDSVIHGKGFDPVKITSKSAVSGSSSPIEYETCKKYSVKNTATAPADFNAPFFSWRIVDVATSSENDLEKFDELDSSTDPSKKYVIFHEDRYQSPYAQIAKNSPTREQFSSASSQLVCCANSSSAGADESGYKNIADDLSVPCTCASLSENGTYTKRKTANDSRVQVLVENDKIKVVTDNDVGYAFPAQCKVDIVLACPTNAAATNKDNRDKNSDTAGAPCSSESEIASCPIYQIGQALRGFVKQFYHTRGVTMGLVPYGGKVSLSPEVAEKYTVNYAKCNSECCFYEGYYLGIDPMLKPEEKVEAFLRGAVLYDSCGQKGYDLDDPYKNLTTSAGLSSAKKAPYDWNTALTACPIRCRGPIDDTPYQGNVICVGDIFSTAEPDQSRANTLFFRQNSNPCYGGNANLLSMKCEQTSPTHLPNPYYIIEPTADLQKIYEMCGALYPFYDDKNVSNFIFIPVTWANNLWQSWTRDPGCPASGDNLSIPSKVDNADAGTSGGGIAADSAVKRKKALILVINKPDWFEPNELTYLGFDNDFSELPMIESDRIDFSENYAADANKKFADGTPYDGTIQGAKKILTVSNSSALTYNETTKHYECNNGTVTLKFPRKYLVKIVVEPTIRWKKYSKLNQDNTGYKSFAYLNGYFFAMQEGSNKSAQNAKLYKSDDAINWTEIEGTKNIRNATDWNYLWCPMGYNKGKYIVTGCRGYMAIDADVANLKNPIDKLHSSFWLKSSGDLMGTCHYNDQLIFLTNSGSLTKTSDGGETWDIYIDKLRSLYEKSDGWLRSICNGNGKLLVCGNKGYISTSTDGGNTWKEPAQKLEKLATTNSETINCAFGNGKFAVANKSGYFAYSTDGENWTSPVREIETSDLTRLIFAKDRFFAIVGDGTVYGEIPPEEMVGYITFSNISPGDLTKDERETITERREFFIEADQISGSDGNYTINMNLENIRLVSAEITNRPYEIRDREVQKSGDDSIDFRKEQVSTIQGANKVLTVSAQSGLSYNSDTGYYECEDGSITLKSPHKPSLKVIVEPLEGAAWKYLGKVYSEAGYQQGVIGWDGTKFLIGSRDRNSSSFYIVSRDGKNWEKKTSSNSPDDLDGYHRLVYGAGKWVTVDYYHGVVLDNSSGDWVGYQTPCCGMAGAYGDGIFMIISAFTNANVFTSTDGASWTNVTTSDSSKSLYTLGASNKDVLSLAYLHGKWISILKNGKVVTSEDDGVTWSVLSDDPGKIFAAKDVSGNAQADTRNWYGIIESDGKYWAMTSSEEGALISSSDQGKTWSDTGIRLNKFGGSDYINMGTDGHTMIFRSGGGDMIVSKSGSYVTFSNISSGGSTNSGEYELKERREFYIEPQQIAGSDGNYTVRMELENVRLISAEINFTYTDTEKELVYSKIRTPDESRVVDFRENKNNIYTYKVCGKEVATANNYIAVGREPNGEKGIMEIQWNATKLCWEFYPADKRRSQSDHFWPKGYPGEMYMLADATEILPTAQPYYYLWIDLYGSKITYKSEYFGTNLYRSFWNFEECKRKSAQFGYTFETFNTVLPLIYAGFTLPINAILYHAYYGGEAHEGEWYVDESNQQTYDASEAAKNATKKALSVLKSEWGDDLRIYLIFFRKQEKYKHKITGSNTNYSYKYLNDCGDIYAKYDVTTEGDLKTKLNEIASEIKTWAGYEEAKNGTTH